MGRSRPMRVPDEFAIFVNNLSRDFAEQTGLPKSDTATMRRMAKHLDGKLITRGVGFDFALIGRTRKKR